MWRDERERCNFNVSGCITWRCTISRGRGWQGWSSRGGRGARRRRTGQRGWRRNMRSSYGGGHFGCGSSDLCRRNILLPHDDQVNARGQAAELRQCLHLNRLR